MIQGSFVRLPEAAGSFFFFFVFFLFAVKESSTSRSLKNFDFLAIPALHSREGRSANSSQPAGTDFIWKMTAIYQRYDSIVFTAIPGQNRRITDHWIRGQTYGLFMCIYRGQKGSNKAYKLATNWLEDHTGKMKNTTKVRSTDFYLIRSYL